MKKLLVVAALAVVGAGAAAVKMGYVPLPKKAEVQAAKAVTALPVTTARFSMNRIVNGSWQSPAGGRSPGGAFQRLACVSAMRPMNAIVSSWLRGEDPPIYG